jgi:hypothetical protein
LAIAVLLTKAGFSAVRTQKGRPAMSLLVLALVGSVSALGLVNFFGRMHEKAENKALTARQQQIVAAARAKAWRENKSSSLR